MYNTPQSLIVVYKDELVLNQLKKFVETKDDGENGTVVGTADGSVEIVSWNEKMWIQQKKAGTISDKILLIGDVKGADKLAPVIDVKYDNYGIRYGWAGKQALLQVDGKALSNKEAYDAFLAEFKALTLPEKKDDTMTEKAGKKGGITLLFGAIGLGTSFVYDFFADQGKVKQQQLLFGVAHLYLDDLAAFMDA